MSILFSPLKIGNIELPNRFVCSATHEAMAKETGEVTDKLIKRYETLAKGGVGLCITGFMFVHPSGRGYRYQTGIHDDRMVKGLSKLSARTHQAGSKIVFQLGHAGRQTTKHLSGLTPCAPSSRGRDPINFVKPEEMTESRILEIINSFKDAAGRSMKAGADGIQLHAAHGYLISEFLSPYFNVRKDSWGGNDENRFRFLARIVQAVKTVLPEGFPVLVKLNANDFTPSEGVTPGLSQKYAGWLAGLGIDGVEISCGASNYSYMNMCRGDVPTKELIKGLPWWKKPVGRMMIGSLEGKYSFDGAYNLEAARVIKPALGKTPLFLVGGLRRVTDMENILQENHADFISMSRPFIREPFLVNKIKKGKMDKVSCSSCNRCLAAVVNEIPVYCYNKGLPDDKGLQGMESGADSRFKGR